MDHIGVELFGHYFVTEVRMAAAVLIALAFIPLVVVALSTFLYGAIGAYISLAFGAVYLIALGWMATGALDPEAEDPSKADLWL